jgi:chromosome segregation protein
LADCAGQPAPRLARLDLHGFKSFATRTVLVFEPGITAIVGPNGSGKSNIADAVRWVLGETSYNALRSKKTEDVIFAGGKGKAPAGMAEVTVTFNNEDGWLQSEFTEVTVTRRAYRGGENQYFINGRKVRLKDIAHLTASLGHSYTVVGQGLVDAALSQRAEERRGLFEHAADLAGLRMKVVEAERNLAETDANAERLTDLLTELAPRLKSLERSARQAREWQALRDRQLFLQRGHYRRLLVSARERLDTAQSAIAGDEAAIAGQRAALDAWIADRAATQERAIAAGEALASHDARLDTIREQARRVGHERDLVVERQAALDRRREDMQDTQTGLDEQVARVEDELGNAQAGLDALRADVESARREVARLQAAGMDERKARAAVEDDSNAVARAIGQHERQANDLAQRQALLEQKRESAAIEDDRLRREGTERADQIAQLETELTAFDTGDARLAADITACDERLEALASDVARHQAAASEASAALAAAERRHGQASNRLAVLQRVQEDGTGLHDGVRHVMQAHREQTLQGIRGTVAELIAVDAAYDTAIEVALGGHLQDVVVERWRDAEAAIAALRRANAGRATFQPLETLARRESRPVPRDLATAPGVHGVAADLVRCEDEIAVVAQALLGRIVVVDDLPTARRLLGDLPPGWSAVTRGGDIARSGGSVTGGAAVRESGVLGRERDLRELPAEIARFANQRDEARNRQESVATQGQEAVAGRTRIEADRAGLLAQRRERAGQRDRLVAWLNSLRDQQDATDRRTAAATQGRDAQTAGLRALGEQRHAVAAALDGLRTRHEDLLGQLAVLREAASDAEATLMTAQRELAALEERLRAEERRMTSILSQRQGLADEMAVRARRLAELDGERNALAGQRERLDREVTSLTAARESAASGREPLAEAVSVAERAATMLAGQIETAREELLERERLVNQGSLAVERARSELATIHQRIADDLALDDPDTLLELPDREDDRDDAWLLSDDHAEVEREIGRLRDRLRRAGYAGDDVVEEYERESAHFTHLTTQLADVTQAAQAIRSMLADLHETMQRRFEETFAQVAAAFTETFTVLFGGGTARLVLASDDETGAPGGIDIVAQPPGKRLQSLGLLSGGERALTAVALLFAILRVNPAPFVLLDEVDAALDEANVVRFRDELRTLAHQTQAIVITHNRGTVEIADTLYGITMGGDGVSQTLSLRLGDLPLDDEIDVRDLPAIATGVPVR